MVKAPHVLTQTTTRVLEPSDLDAALAVLDREPVANAFVTSRVQVAGLDPWRLGGEMWGWYEDGMLDVPLLRGRQPGPDLRHPPSRTRLRGPRPQGRPPLLLHRRPVRRHRPALAPPGTELGPGP